MAKRGHTAEQITSKLREAKVALAKGHPPGTPFFAQQEGAGGTLSRMIEASPA